MLCMQFSFQNFLISTDQWPKNLSRLPSSFPESPRPVTLDSYLTKWVIFLVVGKKNSFRLQEEKVSFPQSLNPFPTITCKFSNSQTLTLGEPRAPFKPIHILIWNPRGGASTEFKRTIKKIWLHTINHQSSSSLRRAWKKIRQRLPLLNSITLALSRWILTVFLEGYGCCGTMQKWWWNR